MSDVPDGSAQMPRRARVSDGGAPVSGALAIVLAVVAVVAGFLVLRSISDGGEQALDFDGSAGGAEAAAGGTDAGTDDAGADSTIATLPTTTTEPPLVVAGASVLVANANTVSGSASSMTRALETGPGFTMVDPVNASTAVGDVDESVIYFEPSITSAQQVADSLSRVLGGVATIAPMPTTPPTSDGSLNGAGVLLMLGNDKAGKTLAELAPQVASDGATVVTNPPVAGESTTTTAG